jgi:hypothetical protein
MSWGPSSAAQYRWSRTGLGRSAAQSSSVSAGIDRITRGAALHDIGEESRRGCADVEYGAGGDVKQRLLAGECCHPPHGQTPNAGACTFGGISAPGLGACVRGDSGCERDVCACTGPTWWGPGAPRSVLTRCTLRGARDGERERTPQLLPREAGLHLPVSARWGWGPYMRRPQLPVGVFVRAGGVDPSFRVRVGF